MKKGQHKPLFAYVSALTVLITLVALVSMNGCGNVTSYPDNQQAPPTGSLLVITAAANATSLIRGNTLQLTATDTSGSTPVDVTSQVVWESLNTVRATVSSTGLVTGVAIGTVSIKATSGTLGESTINLLVKAPPTGSG